MHYTYYQLLFLCYLIKNKIENIIHTYKLKIIFEVFLKISIFFKVIEYLLKYFYSSTLEHYQYVTNTKSLSLCK